MNTMSINSQLTSLSTLIISSVLLTMLNTVSAKQVTLNLKQTDIHSLVETVAEITGKNFVVDPRVNGQVTVISAQSIDEKALYQVFLSVLQVHGFAAVDLGNVIKILPEGNALQSPIGVNNKNESGAMDELVTRVIKVAHITPNTLVPIIRPLMPQQAFIVSPPNSKLLLITDRAANVRRISEIIKKIDLPHNAEVEVIRLEHAIANDVADLIRRMQLNTAAVSANHSKIAADQRINSLLLSGDLSQRVQFRSLIAHLDTPIENSGNTQVVFLKYANAKNLAALLTDISKSKQVSSPDSGRGSHQKVAIQADETTNALIITAPAPHFAELRRIINQLDLRRAQVLVEAIIAEVNSDFLRELGAEGFFGRVLGNDTLGPGISSLGNSSLSNAISDPIAAGKGLSLGLANLGGKNQWGVLLKALEGNSSTNILSTPTLVTLDNHEANFVVAQNVPFVTGQYTNTGDGSNGVNPFQTIQRQNVGLTLKITPQINDGSSIRLSIEQESSSISSSTVATDLITNERKITTSVIVDDDEILVLGGLNQNDEKETVTRTPVLGSIPIVGRLFQSTSKTKSKQILMVFIHPVILRDVAHRQLQTNAKYSALRDERTRSKEKDSGLKTRELTRLPVIDIHSDTSEPKPAERLLEQAPEPAFNHHGRSGPPGYRRIQ